MDLARRGLLAGDRMDMGWSGNITRRCLLGQAGALAVYWLLPRVAMVKKWLAEGARKAT